MASKIRLFLIIFVVSLLSFTFLDYLPAGLFIQWDGSPIPYLQRIIVFVTVLSCRTIVAQIVSIKLFGVSPNMKSILYSLIVFGPPTFLIQLVLGFHFFLVYVPVDLERTFAGAVIGWLELVVLHDFSRFLLIYYMKMLDK